MSDSPQSGPAVTRSEGEAFFTGGEALMKGLLEAEIPIALVTGVREGGWKAVFDLAGNDAVRARLRAHACQVAAAPTAVRAVRLAVQAARAGQHAMALVPVDDVHAAAAELARVERDPRATGGRVALAFEEDVLRRPGVDAFAATEGLRLPLLLAEGPGTLKDAPDLLARLGRAAEGPVGIVVDRRSLDAGATMPCWPNRETRVVNVETMMQRRRRRTRVAEGEGLLRAARRLDLARLHNLPNPGERVEFGFVAAGPAIAALKHVFQQLGLSGRVPFAEFLLARPLDDSVLGRFMLRCENLVMLEPRPGVIERDALRIAEDLRRTGERPPLVWGSRLPASASGLELMPGPGEATHPSILVRRILHLLDRVCPGQRVATRLAKDPPEPPAGAPREAVNVRLRHAGYQPDVEVEPTFLSFEGAPGPAEIKRVVPLESWTAEAFRREGVWAVLQAAEDARPRIFLVRLTADARAVSLEAMVRATLRARPGERVRFRSARADDEPGLRAALREAAIADEVTVVLVEEDDAAPARADDVAAPLTEEDRLGFRPTQRVIRPIDAVCVIRETGPPREVPASALPFPLRERSAHTLDPLPERFGNPLRLRLRPRYEVLEVVRTRPPVGKSEVDDSARPPMPELRHSRAPSWRAHLGGLRGSGAGLLTRVLVDAGQHMGFHVRVCYERDDADGSSEDGGWSQVLFTRPREGEPPLPLTARAPYGEAQLLLSTSVREASRATGRDPWFRVADPGRTHLVLDTHELNRRELELKPEDRDAMLEFVTDFCVDHPRFLGDFSAVTRAALGTERLSDLALLGAAYQSGLIPVGLEAIERAVARAQERGWGRALAAFRLGRRLALDPAPLKRVRDERREGPGRTARRLGLAIARTPRGRRRAEAFRELTDEARRDMPGLRETDGGRQAARDLVIALNRCLLWGGPTYARRYRDLVARLYREDRGDRGRSVTRHAILPLADAMLVRDNLYLARAATSAEQRLLARARLRVRGARGDEIERRYVNRVEAFGFGYRLRLDFVSSDWTAHAVRLGLGWMPERWRGTPGDRERREYVAGLVERAAEAMGEDYDWWDERMRVLFSLAERRRLHRMSASQVRALVEREPGATELDEPLEPDPSEETAMEGLMP